jgi:hypothetical protein
VAGLGAAVAAAAPGVPVCPGATPLLIEPQTQGTSSEAVAFVTVLNGGSACHVHAVVGVAVVRGGRVVRSIRGNPVSERLGGTVRRGVTTVLGVWWSNWCGDRHAFRARATEIGASGGDGARLAAPLIDTVGRRTFITSTSPPAGASGSATTLGVFASP